MLSKAVYSLGAKTIVAENGKYSEISKNVFYPWKHKKSIYSRTTQIQTPTIRNFGKFKHVLEEINFRYAQLDYSKSDQINITRMSYREVYLPYWSYSMYIYNIALKQIVKYRKIT